MATTDKLIGQVPRTRTECVKVQVVHFGGHERIDVRTYILAGTATDDLDQPTKKGLCLSAEVWRELLPVIAAALDE